jgi:hypothetical protein
MLFLPLAFQRAPAFVMVTAVSGVPAPAVVHTAVDINGVPAVARVTAVAAVPIAVDVSSATGVSNVSGSLMLLTFLLLLAALMWFTAFLLMIFPSVLESLLLLSPFFQLSIVLMRPSYCCSSFCCLRPRSSYCCLRPYCC